MKCLKNTTLNLWPKPPLQNHKIKMHYLVLTDFLLEVYLNTSFSTLLQNFSLPRPVIHKIQVKHTKTPKTRHCTLKACCTVFCYDGSLFLLHMCNTIKRSAHVRACARSVSRSVGQSIADVMIMHCKNGTPNQLPHIRHLAILAGMGCSHPL